MGAVTSVFRQIFPDIFLGGAEMALAPDHMEEAGSIVSSVPEIVFHGHHRNALGFVQLVDQG